MIARSNLGNLIHLFEVPRTQSIEYSSSDCYRAEAMLESSMVS